MTNRIILITPAEYHAVDKMFDDTWSTKRVMQRDVRCKTCLHWEAYSPHRGKCSHYKQMTADDMACPSWGHRP